MNVRIEDPIQDFDPPDAGQDDALVIKAVKAYEFPKEEMIRRYDWLHGRHLLRGEVAGTAAMGGTGKSNMANIEALEMVSGKQLLHESVQAKPLRVVLVNLEDNRNTMEKRLAALRRHYGLTEADIGDRLIVFAKGEIKFKIARQRRSGDVRRSEQVINDLITFMREQRADVFSIDSFIRTHGVNENDNSAIQAVVECFEEVATKANCAVHLWHHTRKAGGNGVTVESARGAQAFIDSCRSVRILETMTRKERDDLKQIMPDIGEPGYYFRAFNGKRNFAPPAEQSDWFKYVSIKLHNYTSEFEDDGDNIGVVTRWEYPHVELPTLTLVQIEAAINAIRTGGPWRADAQAKSEPWVGVAVARALGHDLLDKRVKKAVAKLVKEWTVAGRLREVEGQDPKRNTRTYVEVVAPPTQGGVRERPVGGGE